MWEGDEVVEKIEQATRLAIDQTTGAAVIQAKNNHPWQNRTGTLEGSYEMRPAVSDGKTVKGKWGSFDVKYAAPVEKDFPALRPAADVEYPKLAERIRANLG